jgi:hypothetical protein
VSLTSTDGAKEKPRRTTPTRGPYDHSHAVCTPDTMLRTSDLQQLALTLVYTSGQDNVKVTAEANTDAAPLHACPPPKTTHGGSHHSHCNSHGCLFSHFTCFRPTNHVNHLTALLRLAHGMRRTNPAPPPPLTLHSLPRGTIHTSSATTPMETRCQPNVATPVVLPRPLDSPTEKESGSTDTIFTYWLFH